MSDEFAELLLFMVSPKEEQGIVVLVIPVSVKV